jgi:hypothetical protein
MKRTPVDPARTVVGGHLAPKCLLLLQVRVFVVSPELCRTPERFDAARELATFETFVDQYSPNDNVAMSICIAVGSITREINNVLHGYHFRNVVWPARLYSGILKFLCPKRMED